MSSLTALGMGGEWLGKAFGRRLLTQTFPEAQKQIASDVVPYHRSMQTCYLSPALPVQQSITLASGGLGVDSGFSQILDESLALTFP